MKKRMICLISAVCLLAGILPVPILAEGNPYQHYETYTYGGTEYTTVTDTYYAWQQVHDRLGISLPDFGDASNWMAAAREAGFQTGTSPQEESIAVWTGESGAHVGYVTCIDGSRIIVNEAGTTGGRTNNLGIYEAHQLPDGYTAAPTGYIYLSANAVRDGSNTGGASRENAVNWAKDQIGKYLDYDYAYGAQCVDLVKFYYAFLGHNAPFGNANAYVWGGDYTPAGWTYKDSPEPGDIAVWTYGQYGHVAIVIDVTTTTFTCVDQNYTGHQYCETITRSISGDNYAAFIRPAFRFSELPSDNTSSRVLFSEWDDGVTTYIGETDASLGQYITVTDGSIPSEAGMILYNEHSEEIARARERTTWTGPYFYKINAELGYTLTPGTKYYYRYFMVIENETYWGDYHEFTTLGTVPQSDTQAPSIEPGGKTASFFDLNGSLDGVPRPNISGIGTADVYIKGILVANDTSDYYLTIPAGSTYEIKDVKAAEGYSFREDLSENLSGTAGQGNISVVLAFSDNTKKPEVSEEKGFMLSQDTAELKPGENLSLSVTSITPEIEGKTINWISSNPDVATVAYGYVTAVAPGEAFIIAVTDNLDNTATCKVKVSGDAFPQEPAPTKIKLTYHPSNGDGLVVIETDISEEGAFFPYVTYTAERAGYTFTGWYYDEALTDLVPEVVLLSSMSDTDFYAGWVVALPETRYGIHYARVTEYDGRFTDVPADSWYYGNVAEVFSMNLMKGKSDTIFSPSGNVTIAEAITMAARLHRIFYYGTENFVQDPEKWYQVYLDYAFNEGIIDFELYFSDVSRPATRSEFAEILSSSLPDSALEEINDVNDSEIPDVPMNQKEAPHIYRLYRAGILTGNDDRGTFRPYSEISRAEAAAILSRMAETGNRKYFMLLRDVNVPGDDQSGE